ncbi:hypothetical protein K458DRAFT_212511 [Lentithecium fluviatile CBS 122367]|uniref:Phospholipid metabolism enzyme regulator n=1 Tax=Lentithecium fluviatile CBS 122367 TaxID=1168545 RepID=A0A6G1ICD4_9PLEO|nr:hypothetical protein K458DRAFT_212511 [Lentithecium fluviatile CBS 122367]
MTGETDGAASFRSITGARESAEPAASSTTTKTPAPAPQTAPAAASDSTSGPTPGPMRHQTLNGARSLNVSGSPSTAASPLSSRDTSPARPPKRSNTSTGALPKTERLSRKSSTDVSPNRGPSLAGPSTTVPSAAAIQRALSSANIPQLSPAATQDPSRVPRPVKAASGSNSGDNTPHWPISPRLKSPPPAPDTRSRSRRDSLRTQHKKPEAASTPAIVVQSSSPGPVSRIPTRDESAASDPEEQPPSMKANPRGASGIAPKLETVQESSLPPTPGFESLDEQSLPSAATSASATTTDDERNDVTSSKVTEDLSAKTKNESGGESGPKNADKGKMQEQRTASFQRPTPLSSKASLSSLSTIRSRTEAPSRNMTVETETVPSVAQATIGNQDRSASGRVDGSLRLRPSNETIRPKKERKPPKRKAPSINSSSKADVSKADVFEHKVASAVNDADSSDSDATFIYESNPPEQQPQRSRHHHSRTPSMTSIASLVDPRLAIRNEHKNPHKKVSMKFANPYNTGGDPDTDRGDGTVRVGSGRISGGSHHHHIGRHGQGRGALTHIVMDSDSSMAQSSRVVRGPSSRHPSQPNSPRFHTFSVGNGSQNGNGNKKHGEFSTYDIDAENAADDERTPLISSRSPRVRTPRRRNSATMRHLERRHRRNAGCFRRFAGCLVLCILLSVVVFSAVGLIFATTKPLEDVEVQEILNVVATQEEIILDLRVSAVNPNIIAVTISDMDVIIFAKSKHVGSDKWWREHGNGKHQNEEDWLPIDSTKEEKLIVARDGVDHGTDPIDDPEAGEPRTMSLGRIYHFDSPLNFDGSFFKRRRVESVGEIRLSKPGNKTEAGGTERWEEVLQYPFELIVRGTFKYQLPLSTRERKVPVTATYFYDPDTEKKRLKTLEDKSEEKRRDLSSTPVTPRPLGRIYRRSTPLLGWYAQ